MKSKPGQNSDSSLIWVPLSKQIQYSIKMIHLMMVSLISAKGQIWSDIDMFNCSDLPWFMDQI